MSIGLLVDFIMHVSLRYFESKGETREEKVKNTLRTMGVPVLIGGISTLLGVVPLAFSTSAIFSTIFVAFLALVLLGAGHGLILLPIVFSIFGTTKVIEMKLDVCCTEQSPTSVQRSAAKENEGEKVVSLTRGLSSMSLSC
jgi:Niemann-Pick C1 protein